MTKRFTDMDLWAGIGSLGWAAAIQLLQVPQLASLISAEAAAAFAALALGRWYNRHRDRNGTVKVKASESSDSVSGTVERRTPKDDEQ